MIEAADSHQKEYQAQTAAERAARVARRQQEIANGLESIRTRLGLTTIRRLRVLPVGGVL